MGNTNSSQSNPNQEQGGYQYYVNQSTAATNDAGINNYVQTPYQPVAPVGLESLFQNLGGDSPSSYLSSLGYNDLYSSAKGVDSQHGGGVSDSVLSLHIDVPNVSASSSVHVPGSNHQAYQEPVLQYDESQLPVYQYDPEAQTGGQYNQYPTGYALVGGAGCSGNESDTISNIFQGGGYEDSSSDVSLPASSAAMSATSNTNSSAPSETEKMSSFNTDDINVIYMDSSASFFEKDHGVASDSSSQNMVGGA